MHSAKQMLADVVHICYLCTWQSVLHVVITRSGFRAVFGTSAVPLIYQIFELGTESEPTATGFAALFLKDTSPLVSIVLNILLYYPLGYLLPILFPKLKPKHVILIGYLRSVATEATQYLLKMGWCETDDVIHNTLGAAIGVFVVHMQSKIRTVRNNGYSQKNSTCKKGRILK